MNISDVGDPVGFLMIAFFVFGLLGASSAILAVWNTIDAARGRIDPDKRTMKILGPALVAIISGGLLASAVIVVRGLT